MLGYTPEQIELFVGLAQQRHNRELVSQAQVVSVGAVTGMTGSPKPMQALERALLGDTRRARSAMQSELQKRLGKIAAAAGVKIERRAKGRGAARGADRR